MEENENGGVTIGGVFRVIMSQKWLALIIAVVITLAGTLGIYFGYGARKQVYSLSFALNLPENTAENSRFSYPDGTYFYFDDYISLNVLQAVKESDEDFSNVNVEKMVKNGAIEINDSTSSDGRRIFTVSINKSYIASESKAKQFLSALAEYPVNRYFTVDVNYNVYLDEYNFNAATTYEEQLGYLICQIEYLNNFYGSFSNLADDNGVLVETYKHNFNSWCIRNGFSIKNEDGITVVSADSWTDDIKAHYYLKEWQTIVENYENRLEILRRDLQAAESVLEEMKGILGETPYTDGAKVINNLVQKKTEIQSEIADLEAYINAFYDGETVNEAQVAASEAFGERIKAIYDGLVSESGYISECARLSKTVYAKLASVSYQSDIVVSGGMGIAVSFIISLIIGLVIAGIAAYAVGASKAKNPKNASAEEKTEPADEE